MSVTTGTQQKRLILLIFTENIIISFPRSIFTSDYPGANRMGGRKRERRVCKGCQTLQASFWYDGNEIHNRDSAG